MVTIETALKLKAAGLAWTPRANDYFAIPERGMDQQVFVISDMLTTIDTVQGLRVVSFQGASEWALDYLVVSEAVWLPREDQIRTAVETALLADGRPEVLLLTTLSDCICKIQMQGQEHEFRAAVAAEAYAQALLFLIQNINLSK